MKSILFNTEMIRAILEGLKTMTRRVVKPLPKKAPPFTDYRLVSREFWDSFFSANENRREGRYEPLGRYILREDDGRYTSMDNSHGCAWVETFDTLEGCLQWLSGKEEGSYLDG